MRIPALLAFLAALFLAAAPARAQSAAEEENTKQTTRQIADSISRRLTGVAVSQLPQPGVINGWSTTSYNSVSDEENTFEISIFQQLLGVDKRWGNFVGGVSGAYSFSNIDLKGFSSLIPGDGDTNGFSLSPYAAYIFCDNFFVNTIAGYTHSDPEDSRFDSNGAFSETAFNFLYGIGDFDMKAKAGYRFTYSDTAHVGGSEGTTYAHTAIGGAEIGYRWGRFRHFIRGQYEHFEPKGPDPKATVDQDSLFTTAGVTMDITEALTVGASYMMELFNSKTDNYGGIVEVRARF